MATNPLLPNERAALYEKLIELLLGLWRKQQLDTDTAYEEWNVDRLRDERNNIVEPC